MNGIRTNSLLRNMLLLGALTAGTVMTQLMPAYHGPAHTVTYPSGPRAVTKAKSDAPHRSSGVDVNERLVKAARGKA